MKKHSIEAGDDEYGTEISDILFGRPAWFIRHSASAIGVVFLLAIGASWFISYPTRAQAPISFSGAGSFSGAASFPSSFASGLRPGESVLVELGSSGSAEVVRLRARVESIVLAQHESTARIRLTFPAPNPALKEALLSGQWIVSISNNDGRRLFFALFA